MINLKRAAGLKESPFLSNKLYVLSLGHGVVEFNGKLMERQPMDNGNYKFRIICFHWNVIIILLKTDV